MLMTHRNRLATRVSETIGVFLSSVLLAPSSGRMRIFDVGRGTNGYEVSVHLPPNNFDDNGVMYIDLIAQRHHIRWGM